MALLVAMVCVLGTPAVVMAQVHGLQGEYYNTPDPVQWNYARLSSGENNTLVFTYIEQTIDFDWGSTPVYHDPDTPGIATAEVGPGAFGARWRAQLMVPETGSYTFQTEADDSVRLYIDGVAYIDAWNLGYTVSTSSPIALSAGSHDFECRYRYESGPGEIRVKWRTPSMEPSDPPVIIPAPAFSLPREGLVARFYNNTSFTPPYAKLRYDPHLYFWWPGNFEVTPPEQAVSPFTAGNYSVIWTGMLEPVFSEAYTFRITCNDGVSLWVNGEQLITDDGVTYGYGARDFTATTSTALTAFEKVPIEVRLRQEVTDASCRLFWSSASQPEEVVPGGRLFPYLAPEGIVADPAPPSVPEHSGSGAAAATLATDPDCGLAHTYTLVPGGGGEDNALFYIDGDTLRARHDFDYETRDSYSVRIRTTDELEQFHEQAFTVQVTNVNEAPTDIQVDPAPAVVEENAGPNAPVGTLISTDPDNAGQSPPPQTHTYTFVPGEGDADNGLFNLNGDALRASASFDFETRHTYSVRVRSTDSGAGNLYTEKALTIHVLDVSEPINGVSLAPDSVEENAGAGALVGTLSTEGAGTSTYALVAGEGDADNGAFEISGGELRTQFDPDYETQQAYSVRIRSTDTSDPSRTFEAAFTIQVTDVNEAPTGLTLASTALYENAGPNAVAGILETQEPDAGQLHTYTLVAGSGDTDNGLFNINGALLRASASLDYEAPHGPAYSVRVRSTDSGAPAQYAEAVFTVTLLDVAEQPTDITLSNRSVAENSTAGTEVGTFATPAEGAYTYALVGGPGGENNAAFTLDGDVLRTAQPFDFEMNSSLSIRVQSTHTTNPAVSYTGTFTVLVTDVNETPTGIALENNNVAENAGVNAPVGVLSTQDPDTGQIHFYTLSDGPGDADNGLFNINGALLRASNSFDYETQAAYSIRVRATDGGGEWTEAVFSVTVQDANEPPRSIALAPASVPENAPPGTLAGTLSADDPETAQEHVYELVQGAGCGDNSLFSIEGNALRGNTLFDFEYDPTLTVRVRATDNGAPARFSEQSFLIQVENLNEPPFAIVLSNRFVGSANAYVGSLSAIDPDNPWAGQHHSYAFAEGAGDDDNGLFQILDGNKLWTTGAYDPLDDPPFSIRLSASDDGTPVRAVEQTFTIDTAPPPGPPEVAEMRRLDESPTTKQTVRFLVAFNKPVVNLDTGDTPPAGGFDDVALVTGGKALEDVFAASVSGQNATYVVTANTGTGSGTLNLEVAHSGGTPIEDETGQTMTASHRGGAESEYLVDRDPLRITEQPAAASMEAGGSHTFRVEVAGAQGGRATYQWKHDGANIGMGTGLIAQDWHELVLDEIGLQDTGDYTCEVSDAWETVVSQPAALEVYLGMPASGSVLLIALAGFLAGGGALIARRRGRTHRPLD